MNNSSNHDDLISIAKKYTGITEELYDNSTILIEKALDNIGYIYNFSLYRDNIKVFYNKLTTLNNNIDPWPSGNFDDFYLEFFNPTFLSV